MSDTWETFNKLNNTVAASAVIAINNDINITECIEIALPSSVIRQKIYLKKLKRSDLGFFVSQFGKTLLCNPELWWKKRCLALLVLD